LSAAPGGRRTACAAPGIALFSALIAAGAFAYALFLVLYTAVTGGDTPGFASIMLAVTTLGGLNMLALGVLGEYVGRIANEVRGRPLYVVASKVGFEE